MIGKKNEIKWLPSQVTLPMKSVDLGESGIGAVVILVIAGVTGLVGFAFLNFGIVGVIFGILFLIIGLGLILLQIYNFLYRKEVVIDQESVAVSERGFLGTTVWREPLASYEGVIVETYSGRSPDFDSITIRLVHSNPKKSIPLAVFSYPNIKIGSQYLQETLESFSKLLSKPILEGNRRDLQKKSCNDSAKPTKKKSSKSLDTQRAPKLSNRALVEDCPGGLRIYHPHLWGVRSLGLPLIITLGMATAVWALKIYGPSPLKEQMPLLAPLLMTLFPLLVLFGIVMNLSKSEELIITDLDLRYRSRFLGRWKKQIQISWDEIVDFDYESNRKTAAPILFVTRSVESNSARIRAVTGVPREDDSNLKAIILILKTLIKIRPMMGSELISFGQYLTNKDKLVLQTYLSSRITSMSDRPLEFRTEW